MNGKREVLVFKGKPIALVDSHSESGLVTFRYASMGKCVVVTSHIVNLTVVDSPEMYKEYYDKTFGDITQQEIQDVADKNKGGLL